MSKKPLPLPPDLSGFEGVVPARAWPPRGPIAPRPIAEAGSAKQRPKVAWAPLEPTAKDDGARYPLPCVGCGEQVASEAEGAAHRCEPTELEPPAGGFASADEEREWDRKKDEWDYLANEEARRTEGESMQARPASVPRPSAYRPPVERAIVRGPVDAKPSAPVSPPPPSPLPMGARCRVLTGPVDAYGRSATRDGVVTGWDGVALAVLLDGDTKPVRYVPGRVSGFDAFGRPTHPAHVTWIRGDKPPLLPPDEVVRPPPRDPSEAPAVIPPPADEQFPKADAAPVPPAPPRTRKPYQGILG